MRRETRPDQTGPEHPGHDQTCHVTKVNRQFQSGSNNRVLRRFRTPVSEPSSPIPTLVSFAIHHRASSSCYVPGCQTGNPQVCLLSDLVTANPKVASFKLKIQKLENCMCPPPAVRRKRGSESGQEHLSVE